MKHQILNIALLLDSDRPACRLHLIGIFNYIRTFAPCWKTSLQPDRAAEKTLHGCIADEYCAARAARMAMAGIPVVTLDSDPSLFPSSNVRLAHVGVDNREIARKALSHFDDAGTFKSYLFVNSPKPTDWSAIRAHDFLKQLARRRKPHCEMPHPSRDDGKRLSKKLAELPKPVAVFCANDRCASDVLNVCKAAALSVPEQVAILGVDNDTFLCDCCEPSLSSVAPNYEQEGYTAARELNRLIHAQGQLTRHLKAIPSEGVVSRSSTRPVFTTEKIVQIGVNFIRNNYGKKITVLSVARAMGVSRRLAELRFRECMGTSIGATIAATRIKHVQQFLKTSRLSMAEIAKGCGFANANYLSVAFKRLTGSTPRAWADAAMNKKVNH